MACACSRTVLYYPCKPRYGFNQRRAPLFGPAKPEAAFTDRLFLRSLAKTWGAVDLYHPFGTASDGTLGLRPSRRGGMVIARSLETTSMTVCRARYCPGLETTRCPRRYAGEMITTSRWLSGTSLKEKIR